MSPNNPQNDNLYFQRAGYPVPYFFVLLLHPRKMTMRVDKKACKEREKKNPKQTNFIV